MPLQIIRADLANIKADAIVNSANPQPIVGMGVDFRLHQAAGPRLLEERRKIGFIDEGEVVVTEAFGLSALWVFHTVGPLWNGGNRGEESILALCYANALSLAEQLGCESIAFPLISTGTLHFPKDLALRVAADTIRRHLLDSEMTVILVVYDKTSFVYSEALFGDVEERMSKIDEAVSSRLEERHLRSHHLLREMSSKRSVPVLNQPEPNLPANVQTPWDESALASSLSINQKIASFESPTIHIRKAQDRHAPRLDPFAVKLFDWIDERHMTNAECYRKANIDKKLFAKINKDIHYQPKKVTALAFCIALKLDLEETQDLIGRAGYCLSSAIRADVIVMDFIRRKHFDVIDINLALYDEGEPLLGSK